MARWNIAYYFLRRQVMICPLLILLIFFLKNVKVPNSKSKLFDIYIYIYMMKFRSNINKLDLKMLYNILLGVVFWLWYQKYTIWHYIMTLFFFRYSWLALPFHKSLKNDKGMWVACFNIPWGFTIPWVFTKW